MRPDRTELEWTYEPTNFFEVPYCHSAADYELVVNDGRVLVTLTTATELVATNLEQAIRSMIDSLFLLRQLQNHRPYELHGPRTYQHSAGRTSVSVRLVGVASVAVAGQAEVVVQNAAGEVVRDSRSERIESDKALLEALAPKVVELPVLRSLLESYSRSIVDPGNELVHLYEVRDSLSTHFGGEEQARKALKITKNAWQRLGILANVEPVAQGRHRGKHLGSRRTATGEELEEARTLVRAWIISLGSFGTS